MKMFYFYVVLFLSLTGTVFTGTIVFKIASRFVGKTLASIIVVFFMLFCLYSGVQFEKYFIKKMDKSAID